MRVRRSSPGRAARVVSRALAIICAAVLVAAEGDEAAPRLRASDVLSASSLKGPHYAVAEAVTTPAFFHQFTLTSAYGTFTAEGRSQVPVRASEIEALAALDEVSKTEVFLSAAGQSVINVGKGAANVVTDPAGTAKGFGAGVKRFVDVRVERGPYGTETFVVHIASWEPGGPKLHWNVKRIPMAGYPANAASISW